MVEGGFGNVMEARNLFCISYDLMGVPGRYIPPRSRHNILALLSSFKASSINARAVQPEPTTI